MSSLQEAMQRIFSLHQLHPQGTWPHLYSIQVDTAYKPQKSAITRDSNSD
jgi:hypothetical protein